MPDQKENRYSAERITGLVSVVIPAYNAEKSLGRCIESVLNQTYQQIEIFVVNDGSTDNTESIAKKYKQKIKYVSQANKGETAARNKGFELARGEFVTFIDHDDYWDKEFIASCVSFLQKNPEVIAVSTASEHRSALNEKPVLMPSTLSEITKQKNETFLIIDNFFEFWAKHNHICAGAALLRGRVLDSCGGQRTDLVLSGDLEFWAYLATFGQWGFISRVLLFIDGTQAQTEGLYDKFYKRYIKCSSVERWQERILPRLKNEDVPGFFKIRGRIATWYTFAKVFVNKDTEAYNIALQYKNDLEGKFGTLWRIGLSAGWLTWKPMCILLRVRTRIQYYLRGRGR